MLLIGTKNTNTQTVLADGTIDIGSVYRKYCKKNSCCVSTFSRTSTDITLQQSGIYHVTATFVGTGESAGNLTVQLLENGVVVPGALSTETITTPTTEIHTFVIDYYIIVDCDSILGNNDVVSKTISFENASTIDATFTNVVVNITKEV